VLAASKTKRRANRWAAVTVATLLFVLANSVAAQTVSPDERSSKARAAYELAEKAAADLRFATALAAYDQAIALDPSAPLVRVARARAADLRTHAEGDFVPLVRLESVRRNPRATRDDVDALARDAEHFPPGRVRSEAFLVVAEAYWHRFGAPDLTAHALDKALSDASADRLTRALALSELVALERERGSLDAAARVVHRFPDLAPNLRAEVTRLVRREWIGRIAMGFVSAVLLLGFASVLRAIFWLRRDADVVLRAAVQARSVAFSLYIGGAASLLVRLHGDGDVRPFLWLGFGVLAIDIAARGWRMGFVDERTLARVGRAMTCGIAVLAVAFLALQYADASYLETLGL
jgi:tetratricopeptide (TPR) repeat protein